jgi:hypothetical protein
MNTRNAARTTISILALAAAGLGVEPCWAACGPPPPPQVCGRWRCIAGDNSYEFVPHAAGSTCQTTNICDGQGNCVAPIVAPGLSNLHMVTPAQVGYHYECGGGPAGAHTFALEVSRNGRPWEALPDTCSFFGSGDRFDSWRVAPEQGRCYRATVTNPYGTRTASECYTTPSDLVPPTPPSASAVPGLGWADIRFRDRSDNETEFRVYGRRANQGAGEPPRRTVQAFEAERCTIVDDACMPGPGDTEVVLCTDSRVEKLMEFPYSGRYRVRARVRADPNTAGPPVLSFRLDGTTTSEGSISVPGTTTTTVEGLVGVEAGWHVLALAFVNDDASGGDRNLTIDSFTVEGPLPVDVATSATYQAEDGIIRDDACMPGPGATEVCLCTTSRIEQAIAVPGDGHYRIRAVVRPDPNVAGPPNLEFKVDGVTVGSVDVPGSTGTTVEVVTPINATAANFYTSRHTVTLAFTNDNITFGDDRNLYVDSFTVEGPLFSSDWQRLCTQERYTSDHDIGFPHGGTGDQLSCGMWHLTPGLDYEAKVEAYHPRAERTSTTSLPVFRSLVPVPPVPRPRTLQVTNDSVTIGWDPSQYATSYKIYRSGPGGGAVSLIATTTATQYSGTGLEPNRYYCFEVSAANASGESARTNDCETTRAEGPQPRVITLELRPSPIATGHFVSRASTWIDGTLDFLELRPEDNPGTFAGLITSSEVVRAFNPADIGRDASQGCSLSAAGAVFLDADGTLQGPRLAALYGSEHPFLKAIPVVWIGGCPIFTAPQAPPPPVRIRLHYTGYAP